MKHLFKTYMFVVYLLFFYLLFISWNGLSYPQLITSLSLVVLTKLINMDVIKDLQSSISYFIVYPFIVPAIVFLDPFYSMIFLGLFQIINILKAPFYKRFYNASTYGIAIYIVTYLFKLLNPTLGISTIYSAKFFLSLIILTFLFSFINKISVLTIISLEQGKFDINSFISYVYSTKTAFTTIFLGLINTVIFYYTNIIGVAIFTFAIYFIKPALTYRAIFDNELSTYTNFVLHMLKQMDPITHQHSERVKFWTVMLAKKMKLPSSEIRQLSQAASWHDIGKIEVPFDILNKPGRLTDEEYNIIKHHPEAGYQLVKDVHFFKKFLPVIRHHHEKVDGTGYPHRLVGDKIPLHARIMAITDAFDAMTFDRSYRKAMSMAEAVEELKKYAGKQFDANIVAIFIEALQDEYGQEFEQFDEKVIMNVS